jgi:hypothetical protein
MIPLTLTMTSVWTPTAASVGIIAPAMVMPLTSLPEKQSGINAGESISPAP